jgi:predicted Zn-dependent protease
MNPMDDNRDEEQIEAFLSAAARDIAPPDPAFLERLREQSTEVFLASTRPLPLRNRRRFMTARILRVLATSAAALALIGTGLYWWLFSHEANPALGSVLDNVAQAKSLHCRITRDGKTSEVWAESSGRLRRDDADGTYQIAAAGRLWRIDEKANRATSGKSPYHRETDRPELDLLALLGLPAEPDRASLAGSRPVGQAERGGIAYLVYHLEIPAKDGPIEIEALVDPQTHLLQSLQAKEQRNGEAKPLAQLTMLAYNQEVPEEKFVVSDTLTEDGRVGKVTDVQGIVSIKPVMHQRWTPVGPHFLIKPGDWLRTDLRGANAAEVRLVKRTRLILGPGTLIEVIKPDQIRLLEGELESTVPTGAKLEIIGPRKQTITAKGTQRTRLDKEQFVAVDREPLWLKAFKGKTNNESIGSLVALVDGRNVPLTVGQHKVAVDIRDQIARTVIEETFVNHTNGVLEGVFHFPLPPGASVAGFAMWIGDKKVDADIVEKQRAREIYETILQEKRDPGLLEWTGGNIFKARVYPIFAHSEKRIQISYTQVLPRKGGRYRYNYALQSDLLQQTPLRQLDIDVRVNSAAPLKDVTCPTHPGRLDRTAHSAHVEFTAQEYTPTRDFEVVVEADGKQADVVLIPHRRGDDGYFMLQLTPPADGGRDRDILPDGEPLHVLVLADTSASMDAHQRTVQANFVAALLSCLTSKDTVNLAACDVECDWAFEKAVPAEPGNVATLRQFLARRTSLGWTDLDKTFASALQQCEPDTQVIYVGDGIITTGDADAAAFTKRLRRLYDAHGKIGTFHAVTPGSSFESGVVKSIAALGGGSVRHVGGEQTPAAVALELLDEIAQPALRDLKVEFHGLRTAGVYPEQLPNLPAGTQQILLGRYLPEGRDQGGEAIFTGTRGGKPVRFRATVSLKDAERGNSFIPRLWARMHLDHLLEQGGSQAIHDEIIALSEEFQIITPYTSLLVLESDADRERFGVKRTFRMRDGEKFFAAGRDNANFELKQQQMKRAGDWRLGLHRRILRQLATLGRDPRWFQDEPAPAHWRSDDFARRAGGRLGETYFMGGVGGAPGKPATERMVLQTLNDTLLAENTPAAAEPVSSPIPLGDASGKDRDQKEETDLREAEPPDSSAEDAAPAERGGRANKPQSGDALGRKLAEFGYGDIAESIEGKERLALGGEYGRRLYFRTRGEPALPAMPGWYIQQSQWLNTLFPQLPETGGAKGPQPAWAAEARALVQSLLRSDKLAKLQGGVEIVQQTESFDVRWGDLTARSRLLALLSAGAWLTRTEDDAQASLVNWCDGRERGIFSRPFQLGRVQTATPLDLHTPPLDLSDYSLSPLDRSYVSYVATLEPQKDGRTLLVLKHPSSSYYETRVLVDTTRHVIVRIEQRQNGKRTTTTQFDDFVEVGGSWWARKIETTDDGGRVSSRLTRTIKMFSAETLTKQVNDELAGKDAVQFLHLPLRSIAEAKKAVAADKGTFDDHFALLRYFAGRQQWTRAREHLQKCEARAAGKSGVRWLRYAVMLASRRHEELRKQLLEEADRLAKTKPSDPANADDIVLAEYIAGQAVQVLQANEMLALLDQLKSIYSRQPGHRHSMKRWTVLRLSALQQTGQTDETLRVQKQLAVDWQRDSGLQQQYAQALANAGDYPAAYAWLKTVLEKPAHWLPSEKESLHSLHAQFLEAQGRYPELADYLAEWITHNPESASVYAQYLSALIRSDRMDAADALLLRWLREGQTPGEKEPAVLARVQAAISHALGQGHNFYTGRMEERWQKPLAEAALFFARHDETLTLASNILSAWQFQQTDAAQRVRQSLLKELANDLDKLSPNRIEYYLQWTSSGPQEAWKQLGDGLHKRWSAETDAEKKHQLGRALVQVLNRQDNPASLLAFLHAQLQKGPAQYRTSYAVELFETLLRQPWSAEYEDEAFALLAKVSDAENEGERLRAKVAALYRLTDRMIAARREAKQKAIEHPEKLTRIELRKKQDEILRQSRAGFAERLQMAGAKERGPLQAWLKIERLYLLTLLDQDLPKVAAECWEFLGAEPRKPPDPTPEQETARQLDDILRDRQLLTLLHLASRKNPDPALIARMRKYLDRGVAQEEDGSYWKQLQYELLIALDLPKDLEKTLNEWIRAGDADNRWRLSLAFVLAEQGRIPEAIKLLEAIEARDELGPIAYRTLSDWYLAANRRDQHERARLAMYKSMDEWQIHRSLAARLNSWQYGNGQAPPEVNQDVLLMFAALLDKASSPPQHLGLLQQYYQATHDFRLLTGLAEAVLGHTAEKVYPFLGGLQSLLSEVVDEATVDELGGHLTKLQKRVRTTVDRRALDLLECLVRRRAAELKNQPGPHAEAALSALQRAFKGEWSSGEPRLMADFLAGLGAVPQAPLAKEQLRQLEALHRQQGEGSFDRLHIALRYAVTLAAHTRTDQAIAVLQAALTEFQQDNGGILPVSANDALGRYILLHEDARHYDRGEKVLLDQLGHPIHEQQRYWLTRRLYQLYHNALSSDGAVSLGSGAELYRAVERKLRGELPTTHDQEHRRQLIDQLCGIYGTAHNKKLSGVAEDLRAFALKQLPGLLKRQTNNYQSVVSSVAQTMHNLLGPRDGIEILLTQMEQEPAWLRVGNQDGWGQFSWTIAQWKEEAKGLGDLDKRLLTLVLAELRRDLESGQYRNRVLYHRNYTYFWAAKESDFAKTAEEVLAKHPQSNRFVQHIAEYLYHGLTRYPRAIEVLLAAHKGKLLDETGQWQLVTYLHGQNRYAESIPLLQPLVARNTENLQYRVRLMSAYFHTGQQEDLLALLKQTDVFFHEKDRWQEQVMATLAASCLDNKLYPQSVAYYNEAIPLHQRTHARRGIGDGVLSSYYAHLARAFAGLGKTADAVDAAAGAIVSWGPTHQNRSQAIEALKQVLREAADLDGYVAARDNQTSRNALDSAIIRKALGQVYLTKGAFAKAMVQLQLAIALQPNDPETHRLLIDCLDKQGDKQKAILALQQAAELSRRDIKLYQDLGKRLGDQPKEAERAYTSIVEVTPSESEGHALLAEVRQEQNRWPEAVTQWKQVARIRALEPTGLLKLAAAQIHLRQWDEASQTLRKVGTRSWPQRFGDVRAQVRQLEGQIGAARQTPKKN